MIGKKPSNQEEKTISRINKHHGNEVLSFRDIRNYLAESFVDITKENSYLPERFNEFKKNSAENFLIH